MAAGTWQTHGPIVRAALSGEVDLHQNANLFWMLSSVAFVPNPDMEFQSSITNPVSGTNVPAAGIAATGATVTYNAGTNTTTFTVADVSVASATATGIRVATLVDKTTGNTATNRIIASVVFDADLSPNNGPLAFDVPADGVFSITV